MKALFIGDTGTVSMSVTLLALKRGWDVTLLNRGSKPVPGGMDSIVTDIHDKEVVAATLEGKHHDVVVQFIGFIVEDVMRDIRLFRGKTKQYIYISSVSAYQKPVIGHRITEGTPLINPYWEYSRNKTAAEDVLLIVGRREGFPATIIRSSHTYDGIKPPVRVHGAKGNWQTLKRIMEDKPVTIPDDGSSLWISAHSDDFTRGYVGLMGNPHAIGYAYHITSGEGMTWNQIYETIAEALGKPLNALHVISDFFAGHSGPHDFRGELLGDRSSSAVFDNTKIKRVVLDFVCTVSMAEGLGQSVACMLDHPETQVEDPESDRWCDRTMMTQRAADQAFGKGV